VHQGGVHPAAEFAQDGHGFRIPATRVKDSPQVKFFPSLTEVAASCWAIISVQSVEIRNGVPLPKIELENHDKSVTHGKAPERFYFHS